MDTSHDKLLRDALRLPVAARAALAGSLLQSLEGSPDPGAEAEWEAEINKRLAEIDGGSVQLVPWGEARRTIHGAA